MLVIIRWLEAELSEVGRFNPTSAIDEKLGSPVGMPLCIRVYGILTVRLPASLATTVPQRMKSANATSPPVMLIEVFPWVESAITTSVWLPGISVVSV